MLKGIKRGVISLIVALLLLVPFSFCVFADDYESFEIPITKVPIFDWWYQHGFRSYTSYVVSGGDADTTTYSGTLNCSGSSVDSTGSRYCTVWNASNVSSSTYSDMVIQNTSAGSISGTYRSQTSYNDSWRIGINDHLYVMMFITSINAQISPSIYSKLSSYDSSAVTTVYRSYAFGDFRVHIYTFTLADQYRGQGLGLYYSIDFPSLANRSFTVWPLYLGYDWMMPDDVYPFFHVIYPDWNNGYSVQQQILNAILSGGLTVSDSTTHDLIENGTESSQSSSDSLDTASSSFSDAAADMHSIESGYNDDLNTQLENIDFSDPFESESSLLNSSGFVITIFNNLIADNPLTLLIIIVSIVYVAIRIFGG